jgi:hypothetical protein
LPAGSRPNFGACRKVVTRLSAQISPGLLPLLRISCDFAGLRLRRRSPPVWHSGCHAHLAGEGNRKVVDIMKLDVPMLAGLIFLGTQLLARAQIQGFEGALLSSGVEYGLRGLRAASKQLRATMTNRTR